MFYFKITHRRGTARSVDYRECLKPADVGEAVAAKMKAPGTTSVTAAKISQRAYVRATRPGE